MCTVAFIPIEGKFYMASLRDENPVREKASIPVLAISDQQHILAPIDPKGGGTWVGANGSGSVIILLNGGFVNHHKKESYSRSRGQIVRELLSIDYPFEYWLTMDLTNIEPFTLIVFSRNTLMYLVWDGTNKYQNNVHPMKAHLWSSATIYNSAQKQIRYQAFQNWVQNKDIKNYTTLFDFFKSTTENNSPIFIKDEFNIKTLSYTFIEIIPESEINVTYHDLSSQLTTMSSIRNNKIQTIGIS